MSQLRVPAMLLCLLTSVAGAQPTPDGPAGAPEPPSAEPPPTAAPATQVPAPPPVAEPPAAEPSAEAKPLAGFDRKKGFFIRSEDEDYGMFLTGRFQPFFTLTRVTGPVDYRGAFEVRRMRVILDGNLHGQRLTYKLQIDFGRGTPTVRDAYFDVRLAKHALLRVGQWKRPFSRQHITSSGRLETADRSITDRAFGAGRDVGIAVHNGYEKSPDLEWALGLFNGTGEAPVLSGTVTVDPMTGMGTIGPTTLTNVPVKFRPALVGRIGINRNKLRGYAEADLEGGPLRYGAAASVWLEGDFDDNDRSNQRAQLDYIVKARGFSSTGGLYAMTDQKMLADPSVLDAETSLVGFHVQGGYMLTKHWQVAARYAYTNDPRQKAKTSRDQQELVLNANYYAQGHDAKATVGLRSVKSGDAAFTDMIMLEVAANVGW